MFVSRDGSKGSVGSPGAGEPVAVEIEAAGLLAPACHGGLCFRAVRPASGAVSLTARCDGEHRPACRQRRESHLFPRIRLPRQASSSHRRQADAPHYAKRSFALPTLRLSVSPSLRLSSARFAPAASRCSPLRLFVSSLFRLSPPCPLYWNWRQLEAIGRSLATEAARPTRPCHPEAAATRDTAVLPGRQRQLAKRAAAARAASTGAVSIGGATSPGRDRQGQGGRWA
jgi:hypothetical protein